MEKYVFTQEDLNFIQNLLPDEVQVFLRDDSTVMDTRYNNKNKYIENAYFNFNNDFYIEVENYFSKIGKVTFNNSRNCWWIYY